MSEKNDKEILIPEVLPPERAESREQQPWSQPPPRAKTRAQNPMDRATNFLGPVFSGVVLDLFHIERLGEWGLIFGAMLGFWFGRVCGLRLKHCLLIALLSGYYGMLGVGRFLPVATIAGIFFALKNHTDRKDGAR